MYAILKIYRIFVALKSMDIKSSQSLTQSLLSPTVFRYKNYRFFFFSREEKRMHIHIFSSEGEAKFRIEPELELAKNYGLSKQQLSEIKKIIEGKSDDIRNSWNNHFRD